MSFSITVQRSTVQRSKNHSGVLWYDEYDVIAIAYIRSAFVNVSQAAQPLRFVSRAVYGLY